MAPAKTKKAAAPAVEEDVVMNDVEAPEIGNEAEKEAQVEDDVPLDLITVLAGGSETAASFQLKNEDHTLGNALRYIIMKNPDVEFCGYSIPHPSEALMNIRIQTYEGTAKEALSKGLFDLMGLCDVVSAKFTEERNRYDASDAGKADRAGES